MKPFPPIIFTWSGTTMEPAPRFGKLCDDLFTVGERYRLEPIEERSMRSHRHYFACIREAWMNLPEGEYATFRNETILRKHALIMTGYHRERRLVLSAHGDAAKVAMFMRQSTGDHDYVIVSYAENVVIEWTAKSQSLAAMGAAEFQKSKSDVLDYLAAMIGLKTEELKKLAEETA